MKNIDARKLLIYLHIRFNGNQNLILKELLDKNLGVTKKDVDKFLKDNKVDLKDYCCYIDSDYPNYMKNIDKNIVFVFKRK